ncbi:MAG TPA: patatin-like phospholipase family protein, partial [Thermoanaerobaculia bacterium]
MFDGVRSARRIGYLFGGGSMRCAFQVGVVEELDALGMGPAATLGVSAGAWNAAAVAVGNARRLRRYWRFFCRMPYIDLRNLGREYSPFIFSRMHERGFRRYLGTERLRSPTTLPVFIAATRMRDGASVVFDLRRADDPLRICLATNYL